MKIRPAKTLWLPLAVLCCAALGAAVRSASAPVVFPGNGATAIPLLDTYYHLRRAELVLAGHWSIPRDPVLAYPHGAAFSQPPFFDQLLATSTWLAAAGSPTRETLERCAALIPVILGSLLALLTFALGRSAFGAGVGIAAALLVMVVPLPAAYSCLGRPDHHVAEMLFLAGFLLGFSQLLRRAREEGLGLSDLSPARWRRLPFAPAGVAVLSAVLLLSVQIGGALLLGIVPLFLLIEWLAGRGPRRSESSLLAGALVLLPTAALLVPLYSSWAGRGPLGVASDRTSWFQPLCLGLFGLFPLFLGAVDRFRERRGMRRGMRRGTAAGAALVGSAMLFAGVPMIAVPGFREAVLASAGFLGREQPIIAQVLETQPLFLVDGKPGLDTAWRYSALLLPCAVLGLCALGLMRSLRRQLRNRPEIGFLAVGAVALGLLACLQLRFLAPAAPPLALFAGLFVALPALPAPPDEKGSPAAARAAGGLLALLLIALPAATGTLQSVRLIRGMVDQPLLVPGDALRGALAWMDRNTPDPGGYLDPEGAPGYGVMGDPRQGYWIAYLARRPVVTTASYAPEGLRPAADFHLAATESDAFEAMQSTRCRFAVLTHECLGLQVLAPYMSESRQRVLRTPRDLFDSFGPALYLSDGAGRVDWPLGNQALPVTLVCSSFRLVYESREAWGPLRSAAVKVFERVPGARVTGTAPKDALLRAEIPVRTNTGREFTWRGTATPDDRGHYELRVPYATRAGKLHVVDRARNVVRSTRSLSVSEAAVLSGE